MTQDKIIKILKEKSIETSAKEIYKLHLEELLQFSHKINDLYETRTEMEFAEVISELNEELETKLKELNG